MGIYVAMDVTKAYWYIFLLMLNTQYLLILVVTYITCTITLSSYGVLADGATGSTYLT